jgi:ATP-dependent Lon protease
MTGEITLRGRILRIGGLKEKTMAALRAGIKTVVIPADNEPDLEEIDKTVRRALNFITTDSVDGILDVVLDFASVRGKGMLSPPAPVIDNDNGIPGAGASIKQ